MKIAPPVVTSMGRSSPAISRRAERASGGTMKTRINPAKISDSNAPAVVRRLSLVCRARTDTRAAASPARTSRVPKNALRHLEKREGETGRAGDGEKRGRGEAETRGEVLLASPIAGLKFESACRSGMKLFQVLLTCPNPSPYRPVSPSPFHPPSPKVAR
jgi:hypothetical protein